MSLFNGSMKRFGVIGILIILGIVVCVFHKKAQDHKLDYYVILCGPANSDDEVSYIATKKDGNKYLVQGQMREFPGCRAEKHLGKANKIEEMVN